MCITLLAFCNTASAQLVNINWTGLGDGTTWEDANNWFPNTVPDAENHVANFTNVGGTITFNGSHGTKLAVASVVVRGARDLTFDISSASFGFTDLEDSGVNIDDSTVTFNTPIDIDTGPGNDTMAFNFSAPQFGFTDVTFNQPITTNDHNIIVFTPHVNSVIVRLNEDFAGGNNGDVSIDGTASVGVDKILTADDITISDGDVTLINSTSQLKADTVSLHGGSLTLKGDTTPNNPMPNLTGAINSQAGHITVTDGRASISQGVNLGHGNTIIDLTPTGADEAEFVGGLTRQEPSATVSVLANPTATVKFSSVQGADANGVLPYATYNNSDFTLMNTATGELVRLTSYTPIATANPGDAAEATGNVSLTGNTDVSVLKVNNASLDGGGNTVITDAVLVKGVNAGLLNAILIPHDLPGSGFNQLHFHTPVGGDRLTLDAVIADNIDPTKVTFNAPQAGRVTVNSASTYSGGTNITSGTVILNGPGAGLGSGDVDLGPGALFRLIDNILPNPLLVGAGPFPANIEADGNSTISGNITVKVNTANDRAFKLTAPQVNDSLTIHSTVTRGGTGNPIEGHGMATVQVGETFGDGDITISSTADFTDPNIVTTLNGDGGRNIFIDGPLGNTVILGDIEIAGIGSAENFTDVLADGATSGATYSLAPGSSIGTFTVVQDMLIRGSNFTYNAEVDDAGASDLIAVGGLFDISTPSDTLDISFFSGSTLANADYTLATYGSRVGIFDAVMFDGSPVVDPTAPGAIGGTHRLQYGENSLLLTSAATLTGDFDFDGDVDGNDFLVWQRGSSPNPFSAGDLADWRANYGTGSLGAANTAVPEPSTWVLLSLTAIGGIVARRRRIAELIANLNSKRDTPRRDRLKKQLVGWLVACKCRR